MVEGIPGSKYTIQNYDHSGNRVKYDPKKHGENAFVEIDDDGKRYVQQSDKKIQLTEFQEALMNYYQDKYGKICTDNSLFANLDNPKAMNFIKQALAVRIDNDIEDDKTFQELLDKKAQELHSVLKNSENKPNMGI